MIISVDDPLDSRLDAFRWRDRQLASRSDRLETIGAGLFVAEGDLVVQRALDAHCSPVALLCEESMGDYFARSVDASVQIFIASEDIRRDVTGLGVPLRATGLFTRPPLTSPDDLLQHARRILVAEAVDNPTNLGAIIRSAAGLGWDGLILSSGSADPLARRALRVSMGTGLVLPFARLSVDESLASLLVRHQVVSYALTPDASATNLHDITPPTDRIIALLLGSERDGLDESTMTQATHMVRIPMYSHVDSLNVGAAAAIALHALGPR